MDNFVVTICLLNGLLMLLTIMGNVLVLTAMLKTPSLRSPSTIFLCSLAASDLLVGFVVQPMYIGFRFNPGPELEHLAYILVAGDDPNKQTRNETSRGVSQQVRLGTILRVGKTRKPRKTKGDG